MASTAIVSGNADLWTVNAGVNQDIGISVDGTAPAWKESGGNAGTFSPNAAFVQTVVPLTAGVAHTFQLQWKTNHVTSGTIVAGAGLGPIFSPTRLSVQLAPTANVQTAVQNTQYRLDNSDGVTWQDLAPGVDPAVSTWLPAADGTALVNANVDLWTATARYNQDIGIFESVNAGPYQLVAWKESGGFAGTFSPNAAFVQATVSIAATSTYAFKVQWKTNKSAPGSSIFASAGPGAPYSPTRLTVQFYPGGANLQDAVSPSTSQYQMSGSDGASWVDIDSATLKLDLSAANNCLAILSANADLWTTTAGYNQDIGIQVTTTGATYSPSVVGWKESGGFAGTFSPNAAFVQAIFPMVAGQAYTARLQWKTNRPSPASASILAAAGLTPEFLTHTPDGSDRLPVAGATGFCHRARNHGSRCPLRADRDPASGQLRQPGQRHRNRATRYASVQQSHRLIHGHERIPDRHRDHPCRIEHRKLRVPGFPPPEPRP